MGPSMPKGPVAPDPPEVLALVTDGMLLVDPIVRQLRAELSMQVPQDEMISFGHEGLLRAARSFDRTRRVPFERWATVKIRGAMLEGMRRESLLPRRLYAQLRAILAANHTEEGLIEADASSPPSTAEAADARLTAYLTAMATSMALGSLATHDQEILDALEDGRGTPEDEAIREDLKARVRAAIAEQPDQERRMLERYYFEEKTLEDASGGLSRSWSSRLLAQAVAALARSLRRANVEP